MFYFLCSLVMQVLHPNKYNPSIAEDSIRAPSTQFHCKTWKALLGTRSCYKNICYCLHQVLSKWRKGVTNNTFYLLTTRDTQLSTSYSRYQLFIKMIIVRKLRFQNNLIIGNTFNICFFGIWPWDGEILQL